MLAVNNGRLPEKPGEVTDEEVCTFLVALSRTRQRCHLVSYKWFIKSWLRPSVFLDWIGAHLDYVKVDKNYPFDA